MSCQFVLCFEKCRIIAQSLEHVYNEHETRRVENLTFYLYSVCVYLQRRFALSSYGYSLIGGKILIGHSIVFNIQNHKSIDPFSFE